MPAQTIDLDVRNPRLTGIVAPDALLEPLATGFEFLEGPVWLAAQRALIFSDIPGDTMYRWDAAGGATVYRQPSQKANGNTLDRQGRLLTCKHATSRVVREEPGGGLTVLASQYAGLELNSPNDIVVKRNGAIYFSDPNFGRRPTRHGVPRAQQLSFQAVFRLDTVTGALVAVADDFDQPNGLCFSLDEKRLFVNDSPRGHIRVFDVLADGSLQGGEVWAELRGAGPGVPDGMKFDAAGNLYCAGPGGIHVFDAGAVCLGVIRMPEQAANFCWGGDDLQDLLICASTTLYRVRVQTAGRLAKTQPQSKEGSSMFEIRDLNHVSLVVKDLAAAKRFYCGALEMTELPRPADLQVRGAWLRSQSAEIHLIVEACATHAPGDLSYAVSQQPGIDIGSSRHFSLVINDTQALVQQLAAHEIAIAFGPVTRFGGIVQTYCYDPDGHLVEFTQLQ